MVFRRLASDLDNCFTLLRENSGKVHVCSETEENALILLSPLADLGKIKSHFSSCFDYLFLTPIINRQAEVAVLLECGL